MIFFLIVAVFIILTGIFSFKESLLHGFFTTVWGIAVFVFSILDVYIFALFSFFFGAGLYFFMLQFVNKGKNKPNVNLSENKQDKTTEYRTLEKKKSRERIIESGLFNYIIGGVFVLSSFIFIILYFLF